VQERTLIALRFEIAEIKTFAIVEGPWLQRILEAGTSYGGLIAV